MCVIDWLISMKYFIHHRTDPRTRPCFAPSSWRISSRHTSRRSRRSLSARARGPRITSRSTTSTCSSSTNRYVLTLKRLGYFGDRQTGVGGHDGPPWDLGRGSFDRPKNLHNGSMWCNLQNCIFRFSKKVFFYLILIMLIYARNQTFYSKSVNKLQKCKFLVCM